MSFFLELKKEMKRERTEGIAEGREEGQINALRNIMEGLNLTLEKAMDVLKIPAGDRSKYAAMLQD
ncbi:hypothetical protein HMPREF9162_0292 [Selenomonas sp. oral taxon 137 str. F0430]|uniref:hypothetical protein n=1 Tax=Selenomonas sp. oral taxon 137 TaxID=712531 RepID=UPI0001EB1705|nr:hypothetical protein [Selenomonas sp. oral taxon 137]EFR39895.1 hypothetical protein HMPREF9162_0292 [Selenomonas sp. oral taxon 137 str. F0430]